MNILIIGCGYVGIPLGERLASQGHTVSGLRRSSDADAELRERGITPLHADITRKADMGRIRPEYDIVVNLVSSSKGGAEEYRSVYLEGTRNLLNWLSPRPPALYLYTSSTSVYAQADGSWVTEQNSAEPDSPTSQILIETERELLAWSRCPVVILRASGIYGPGRGHLFKQFLRGEATLREDGSSWINMIHVDDLASAIAHFVEKRSLAPGIYNASDDEPVTQLAFFTWLSQVLGKPLPPAAPADPNRKRGLTNKRVSNEKLRGAGFNFCYPTFREGYQAAIEKLAGLPAPGLADGEARADSPRAGQVRS